MPGFSTREKVSEYSGRGVGLDVVRSMVERFGGHLRIESRKGSGTRIVIHLPLSLTIVDTTVFIAGGQTFAVPSYQVDRFFTYSETDSRYRRQNRQQFWIYEDHCCRILSVGDFYGLESRKDSTGELIRVHGTSRSACLLVDRVKGQQSVVAKPLPKLFGPYFKQSTGIAGCSILGDGSICALLDTEDLIKAALVKALEDGAALTDDCGAVERLGIGVSLTQGDYCNLKITTPEDLAVAEALFAWREQQ